MDIVRQDVVWRAESKAAFRYCIRQFVVSGKLLSTVGKAIHTQLTVEAFDAAALPYRCVWELQRESDDNECRTLRGTAQSRFSSSDRLSEALLSILFRCLSAPLLSEAGSSELAFS